MERHSLEAAEARYQQVYLRPHEFTKAFRALLECGADNTMDPTMVVLNR